MNTTRLIHQLANRVAVCNEEQFLIDGSVSTSLKVQEKMKQHKNSGQLTDQ